MSNSLPTMADYMCVVSELHDNICALDRMPTLCLTTPIRFCIEWIEYNDYVPPLCALDLSNREVN